jgi:hypothetical protein
MDNSPLRSTKRGGFLLFVLIQLFILIFPMETQAKRENLVYFPNTAYELNVYKIYGKKPGKTLMLIGGIQGNEPGGFLSADLYADMSLMKGNLIVVPRANFYSILLNHRGPHGDMNRKFAANPKKMSMDDKIVSILKQLIAESDYLLNLHDGSGYYYPRYISRWRNPNQFGQSIIADCENYRIPGRDEVLRLGEMARKITVEINGEITNDLHKFRFNNTRTDEPKSIHREQLKSATYYALTKHHIPAFGVETSKFLPSIDLKVRYHNLAINAFMRLFGIIPEQPRLFLDPPELKYLVVSINGQIPIVIRDQQALSIMTGDTVNIAHVEANYERGLSVDVLGYGSLNDFREDISIHKDTKLLVRKDNKVFASIPIRANRDRGAYTRNLPHTMVTHFIIEADGRKQLIKNGGTLEIIRGDSLKVIDILPESLARQREVIVNFKGFVGNWKNNTGEDRGYFIDTARDLLERYSIHGKRKLYRIVVFHGKATLGKMFVSIAEPSFEYLIVKLNSQTYALKNGEAIDASMDDYLTVEAVKGNVGWESKIQIRANGDFLRPGKAIMVREIAGARIPTLKIDLTRGELFLGKVYLRIG